MDDPSILVDYYQGAYGPTIRIDIQEPERLRQFRGVITGLASEELRECRLHCIDGVVLTGIDDLILRKESGSKRLYREKNNPGNGPEQPVFIWELGSADWWHCEGLIDGLMEELTPGHQYLAEYDGMIIELCYMERDCSGHAKFFKPS